MTLRELINTNPFEDVDVYENVCGWGIALCGAYDLTEDAENEFSTVLDAEVDLKPVTPHGYAIVILDTLDGDDDDNCDTFRRLMAGLAGYCSESNYYKWFILKD